MECKLTLTGDWICFHWYSQERLLCEVVGKTNHPNVLAMLEAYGVDSLLPGLDLNDACVFQLERQFVIAVLFLVWCKILGNTNLQLNIETRAQTDLVL